MRHVVRSGRYLRVADPDWDDPLSGEHARHRGGRWNSPGSFGAVYLNASLAVARAQVRHKLEPRGIRPEDLAPGRGPVLVSTEVPTARYLDAVTDRGLASLGLPTTYPLYAQGKVIPHATCQPLGQQAWNAGEPGIACRSAAGTAPPGGEELAFFTRRRRLPVRNTKPFADWYWSEDR